MQVLPSALEPRESPYASSAQTDGGSGAYLKETAKTLVKIIAPMVPHTAEEFNERLGGRRSVFLEAYPVCDESANIAIIA